MVKTMIKSKMVVVKKEKKEVLVWWMEPKVWKTFLIRNTIIKINNWTIQNKIYKMISTFKLWIFIKKCKILYQKNNVMQIITIIIWIIKIINNYKSYNNNSMLKQ
jgi:hypothetical protein